jgi:Kef-type K+ transport system membrane component KefB/nucleotide-binding universal stress UspA family protein
VWAAAKAQNPSIRPWLLGAAILALNTSSAFAAKAVQSPSEVVFLVQLIVLILVGRLLGEAMQRIGQPSVMGQLLAGILLGPSALGSIWPDLQLAIFPKAPEQRAMIDAISQFGILLLLLLTGMETDLKLVRKVGRAAISISLTGVSIPFICGFMLGQFLPDWLLPNADQRLLTSLFLGTAVSISSIKIVAAIVREMGFTRRNIGQVIVASAICEDTIGWVIIAITFGLAEAGTIDIVNVAKSVLGTAVFLLASFTVGRPLVFFLIRWANDNFTGEFSVITLILLIMGSMALVTHLIGVHTVLGAFIAGMLVGESPILSKHIDEQLRGLIFAFFMPVFFGMAGLSTDLSILMDPRLLLLALGVIAIASLGKFAGAFIGGTLGGLTQREALALACGMNARGSTEVIVATIGLSMGALSQTLFTMIVAMAIITTLAMPPTLRWALARVPIGKLERARLEREEFEAKGFVSNLERLLLAVDESPNGKFAARLAGLIAGPRGMPTTVLPLYLDDNLTRANLRNGGVGPSESQGEGHADVVKAAAELTRIPAAGETPPSPISVTVRAPEERAEDAIASEAKKGYDLLFVGIKNTRKRSGGFHQELTRATSAFEGPLAVVMARDAHLKKPLESPLSILVPVTGTDVARRAAEVAIAIGRTGNCRITVLYVSGQKSNGARGRSRLRAREQEEAILKEIVAIADRYDYQIDTTMQAGLGPDRAIIDVARQRGHNLIIMGVSRRGGGTLDFGDTAAAVLDAADCSILFIST